VRRMLRMARMTGVLRVSGVPRLVGLIHGSLLGERRRSQPIHDRQCNYT
jgi:hypothetical protein